MNKQQINQVYTEAMICSMELDYESWTMQSCGAAGYNWLEFHSPEYKSPAGSRKSYAFTLNYDGVYLDGRIAWTIPATVKVNPFNPLFWRFWAAKRKLSKYLKRQADQKQLDYLSNHIQ